MQIVNTGNKFMIYDDGLQVYNSLPAQSYLLGFDKMTGFFLTKHDDIKINEKIYGKHEEKVEKVFKSFKLFERNLGVILSGPKGIGKSLFAKMLSAEAINSGFPMIIVNSYIPGVADYLNSIQQEVVVLFDEFDKTFNNPERQNSVGDPQSEMLTLFDGLAQGKKLFIVTCNEIRRLNEFLINRPGRFHYHFRFEYPTPDEIRRYLEDKIPETSYSEINQVISFARKIDLNYDCLRAIAFELSLGSTFKEAIKDLNIINIQNECYTFMLLYKDGTKAKTEIHFDLFGQGDSVVRLTDDAGYEIIAEFSPSDAVYDIEKDAMAVSANDLKLSYDEDYYDSDKEKEHFSKQLSKEIDCMVIKRRAERRFHYNL